jgi:hypothetical protein
MTGKREYLERRIARLEEELAKAELVEARFGKNSDYPVDTVINWEIRFPGNSKLYSYVAIKYSGTMWALSSQYDNFMTFEDMVEKYLSKAESVWIAKAWEEI